MTRDKKKISEDYFKLNIRVLNNKIVNEQKNVECC